MAIYYKLRFPARFRYFNLNVILALVVIIVDFIE